MSRVEPGQRVKELMDKYGMSQADLARAAGLSRPTVNRIIHGKRNITPEWALRIAFVFDIAWEEIIFPDIRRRVEEAEREIDFEQIDKVYAKRRR